MHGFLLDILANLAASTVTTVCILASRNALARWRGRDNQGDNNDSC
ncbi:hypothetical protein NJO91_10005 [Streptomyces microflavus]|nr:hypothetical protein [Streptomyces microflavus]MDX2403457.1 hypothetical protein [Streptomyces microflavus]